MKETIRYQLAEKMSEIAAALEKGKEISIKVRKDVVKVHEVDLKAI